MTERRQDHLDPATIAALVDRTLTADERAAAEAHLAACADCREVWVETSEIAAETRGVAAGEPSRGVVTTARPGSRRWIYGAAGLAAAAALVVAVGVWRNSQGGTERLLEDVIRASIRDRFTEARLSRSDVWGPVPSAQRSADSNERSMVRQTLDLMLARAKARPSATAYHDVGVAYLVDGRPDDAIAYLEQAATMSGGDARIELDLSAAYLEACRDGCPDAHKEAALRAANTAFASLRSASAAFNRSLALEQLGRQLEARRSWVEFLTLEKDPSWQAEARNYGKQIP